MTNLLGLANEVIETLVSFGNSSQPIEITGAHFDYFFQMRLEAIE